ncbi:helix-turn-helix domain-containing protein [Chitinimonas arctica]|uniref:Helix-turn-helix domain-containing protein n=1 Tax=Chitinimonas arctica TaxID=2594795 RepID=A0A516SH04_9NEIS|nr:helix-turn-helix domain-containing protein [Chitinimonas arctica]QDQ27308.1 helix-turn-helix domain-containing protein [Chitinimonas arctica]
MDNGQTLDELEIDLGEKLKRLRLNKNWDQKTLAARAGVSVRALRNIEAGQGSTVKTLLSVVRALGRESWLDTVAPVATVNPLTLTSRASQRVRATSPAVKINAARRLIAIAEQAGGEEQGKLRISSAQLNAARRLIATANQAGDKPVKMPTKSRKKTE